MSYGYNNGFVLLVVLFVLLVIVGSNYPMGNYGW
ncbi:MAG TPA: YjcZ family sporulation protein [Bacillales bacterium]